MGQSPTGGRPEIHQSRRLTVMKSNRNRRSKWCSRGLVAIAALAIGCGGGGGGGGGSSTSGTGNATVSGNLSNQSMALQLRQSPTLLARIVHFLSPVTDAFAAPSGIQVLIKALETLTDGSGSFVVNGVGSG